MDRPNTPLAPTVAELGPDLRAEIAWLARIGFAAVQLSASGVNGLRPREMSVSAKRDLEVTLRRAELQVTGIDLWIPPTHYTDVATIDRAIDAVSSACKLAGGLGRCPVSIQFPESQLEQSTLDAIRMAGDAEAVPIAVASTGDIPAGFIACIDPPRWLEKELDPVPAAANAAAAVRLSDLVEGRRAVPAVNGSLDLLAYRAACEVASPERGVVADVRFIADPRTALGEMRRVWPST
ncbi:MAG: hypothetical protein P8I91_09190 [Phycisphaerales bacterium]|nr:hypothetical protein [Phycisphaerales bacterium]